MTRARAGGTGEEKFGAWQRALVHKASICGWFGCRAREDHTELFDTWAEALAYALREDENYE